MATPSKTGALIASYAQTLVGTAWEFNALPPHGMDSLGLVKAILLQFYPNTSYSHGLLAFQEKDPDHLSFDTAEVNLLAETKLTKRKDLPQRGDLMLFEMTQGAGLRTAGIMVDKDHMVVSRWAEPCKLSVFNNNFWLPRHIETYRFPPLGPKALANHYKELKTNVS